MERTHQLLAKEDIKDAEYDLNMFYEDLGLNVDGSDMAYADVYTIQPSIYIETVDNRSLRFYLEAFKLDLAETRALAPDFPEEEWGSDFFIGLDAFYSQAKAVPTRVDALLNKLPDIYTAQMDSSTEINWIN